MPAQGISIPGINGVGVNINDPGHSHAVAEWAGSNQNGGPGFKGQSNVGSDNTGASTTGITASVNIPANSATVPSNSATIGSVAGTNAPYIQFLVCQKN